jgi:hypothetical protein
MKIHYSAANFSADVSEVPRVTGHMGDMGYGIWDMGYGIWDMGYGIWDMGYGIWDMGYGIWDGVDA